MRKIYEFNSGDIVPTHQGFPALQKMAGRQVPSGITRLMDEARDLFCEIAQPMGLLEDFAADEFPGLYTGNGLNASDGPVPSIVARTEAVALMAATMGDALAAKCGELLTRGRASLGYMLDMVSTAGAELLGRRMCHVFLELLRDDLREGNDIKVQYYCPGHCGWHISGQEKLFMALHPDEIGVSLGTSRIMRPLKSISGILAAAPIEVHRFSPGFSFCPQCRERKCVERLKLLETG